MKNPDPHLLSVLQVAHYLGTSKSTIWRWTKARPEFPKPVKLGIGSTRWRVSELEAFAATLSTAD